MTVIRAAQAPRFELPGVQFEGLAAPSRGGAQVCTWRITVAPRFVSDQAHTLDRDEIFMLTDGALRVTEDGEPLGPGDAAVVPAGQPIFVAPRRSDLDRLDDLLFYVLVGRDSVLNRGATLEALPAQQRATVAALEREKPRIVVRWIDPISSQPEPNLRGRATGSRVLDDYLAGAYRRTAQFGVYVVLERR